jgi:hypothetical protein
MLKIVGKGGRIRFVPGRGRFTVTKIEKAK